MQPMRMTLQKLRLENFKGVGLLELEFAGRSAQVYGDNAAGKTTVYDGLTWLLFGKDSRGRQDFEIQPLDENGRVRDHAAITAVEAELLVNGGSHSFRRTYYEKWSAKRGNTEAGLECHSSDYFADGVPVKKGEYDRRVAAFTDEETFRLLTNVAYFPEAMRWVDRREVLFRLAGIASDGEILRSQPRFRALWEAVGVGDLEDYRKKLRTARAGLSSERGELPARIAENEDRIRMLEETPFAGLRRERDRLAGRKTVLERKLLQAEAGSRAAALETRLAAARNERRALENENTAYRLSQSAADETAVLRRELEGVRKLWDGYTDQEARGIAEAERAEKALALLQRAGEDWNARVFVPGSCPTCGQALLGEALEKAREEFEAQRERGREENAQREAAGKVRLAGLRASQEPLREKKAACGGRIRELEQALREAEEGKSPAPADMPDYAARDQALREKIQCLELAARKAEKAEAASGLEEALRSLDKRLQSLEEQLSRQTLAAELRDRVEALHAQEKKLTDEMDRLDKMLRLCGEFVRYKVSFVEDTVNSLFSLVRFRLYREQVNGGVEDRCDATYRGVPYTSLNNGARINVGLDIIRTISRRYGISVPLFIDNAESVTALETMDCQVIRLVVKKGENTLRWEPEG